MKEVNDTDIIYDINTIAYTIYLKHCRHGGYGIMSFNAFVKGAYGSFDIFYKKSLVLLRKNKINKIISRYE